MPKYGVLLAPKYGQKSRSYKHDLCFANVAIETYSYKKNKEFSNSQKCTVQLIF